LQSQTLKPDYSLSAQHVYIGLFAHLIINLKMHRLFRYAAGFSAPASLPSWLPDWVTPESWQRIFKPWRSDSGELAEFITRNILPHANHSSEDGVRGFCWLFSREWKDIIFHKKSWNRDVIVDINTGALSINLIHLSTISSRPAIIQKRGRMNIFEVKGAKTSLYLAAEGLLESVSCLGADHLFMIVCKGTDTITYLILRELDGNGNYKLIASCPDLFMLKPGSIPRVGTLSVDSLYNEIDAFRSWLHHDPPEPPASYRDTSHELRGFLPGKKKFWDFMPAYRGFFNEQNGSDSHFETSYLSCISQEFRPRIVDGFLELSFSTSAFSEVRKCYLGRGLKQISIDMGNYLGDANHTHFVSQSLKNPWEWRRWQKWTPIISEQPSESPFLPRLYLRASMSAVRKVFEIVLARMMRILNVLEIGLDEGEALLRDGPKDEHRFIGSLAISDGQINDLHLDIRVQQVRIL
jgi:hypothetical protein